MCGFAGFLKSGRGPDNAEELLEVMGNAIANRGPDSFGYWVDQEAGIGFAHRRLAIVDLSPAGHQPMSSKAGRYVIAFNGEIYNHLSIRAEIESESPDVKWLGHSDTETLLAAIELWGLEQTLIRAVGMFALALWDKELQILLLARDRFGEKPLYFGWQDSLFLFGSELKSFRAHPDFKAVINRDALCLYLRHNCVPAPHSIYQDVSKLLPGTIVTVDSTDRRVTSHYYWDPVSTMVASAKADKHPEQQSIDLLETKLKAAVREQMMADVPLGAFLSGGIDSSLIVALMQTQSQRPVKTFSIGFHEKEYDEAGFAKEVAKHLGTEHTELYVTADDSLAVVNKLADIYDEPFSDSSQIPTYLVSKMARQHVTVSLSGDAGDEIFCGYNRYILTDRMWGKLSRIPTFIRTVAAKCLTSITVNNWNKVNQLLPATYKMPNLGDKLHKAAGVLAAKSADDLYQGLVSHWDRPEAVVIGGKEPATLLTKRTLNKSIPQDIPRMMAMDTLTYLPDDILVKVDRAAMFVSLEGRVPFLDHRVAEYAWSMPMEHKLKNGVSKYCLRQILYKYVPQHLIERPKSGFAVPIAEWLRGPLKPWAEQLLDPTRLRQEGFFVAEQVQTLWKEHQSGAKNWQHHLWDILMFQNWYEKHHK